MRRFAMITICLVAMSGCTQYNLMVYKTVVAFPGSTVEMNSTTEATGNTSNPTTSITPTAEVDVSAIPN